MRRSEHKQRIKIGETRLVGSRYDCLRAEQAIRSDKREEFGTLKRSELKTARAWAIKELLKAFWECPREGFAETHFRLVSSARHQRLGCPHPRADGPARMAFKVTAETLRCAASATKRRIPACKVGLKTAGRAIFRQQKRELFSPLSRL